MQTISIEAVASSDGERCYRAAVGTQSSTGRTAGEALDALTAQLGNQDINGFLLLQNHQPDYFFTAQQQEKLTELMSIWRVARDQGNTLSSEQQTELDTLIEAELLATANRSKAILNQIQQ
jgi:hypothetical protein